MTIFHTPKDPTDATLIMKGAPEILLDFCTTVMTTKGEIPLDEKPRKKILKCQNYFAENVERVIAICERKFKTREFRGTFEDINSTDVESSGLPMRALCFVGLLSIIDPPREDVPETIQTLRKAGIRVAMVRKKNFEH